MKRVVLIIGAVLMLLSGCSQQEKDMEQAMKLREMLQKDVCSFTVEITADYGDALYSFTLDCSADEVGTVSFTVVEPQTIRDITGSVSHEEGRLTFDDQHLAFAPMANDQITPVAAPFVFMQSLRSGYIRATGKWDQGATLIIDDIWNGESIQTEVWLDGQNTPVAAEILWQGRRILSLNVKHFTFRQQAVTFGIG